MRANRRRKDRSEQQRANKRIDQKTYKPCHLSRVIKVAAALVDAMGQNYPIENFEDGAVMREEDLVEHVASTGKVGTRY